MRIVLAVVLFLLAAAAGPCGHGTEPRLNDILTIRGVLTDEGVECPALRDEAGVLYTLAGSIGDFRRGDKVCVHGRRAEVSYCMQGITISVEWIKPASACQ